MIANKQDINTTAVFDAAQRFRKALEGCYKLLGPAFEAFPEGSCGDTTILLGNYLIEQKLGEFQYMLGSYNSGDKESYQSHAWLQLDTLVVDITADQFPDGLEKIIVQENSEWHKALNGQAQNIADFRIYDASTVAELSHSYNLIIESLDHKNKSPRLLEGD